MLEQEQDLIESYRRINEALSTLRKELDALLDCDTVLMLLIGDSLNEHFSYISNESDEDILFLAESLFDKLYDKVTEH